MKAICARQPWASMIIQGHKAIENRSQKRKYRGPLLIHAGKSWDQEGADWIVKNFPHLIDAVQNSDDLRGGVIGSVTMIDCVTEHKSPWFFGPYGYVFANPQIIDFKPYPGKLNFFEIPGF